MDDNNNKVETENDSSTEEEEKEVMESIWGEHTGGMHFRPTSKNAAGRVGMRDNKIAKGRRRAKLARKSRKRNRNK